MIKLENYTIKERINKNPDVEIYRAIDPNNREVVLKYISYTSNKQALNNLKKEYDFIHSLTDDSVIKTYGLIQSSEGQTLILEDGGISIKEYFKKAGKLALKEFLTIAIRLTEIISILHKNRIVHKDIKPSNFVINPVSGKVKIIDFGISTRLSLEDTGWKSQNILEGSLPYISPEQTGRVNRLIDYRTDFYSLGITLYELITGKLPYESLDPVELVYFHMTKIAPRVSHVRDDVPEMISLIIEKLMEKDADKRYMSTTGILYDLGKCLSQLEEKGEIEKFPIAEKDYSDRFQIPQKIYGRDKEINELLDVFHKAAKGSNELLLVKGYSGIGKSAFIHETHKSITEKNGYFIHGKFEQFQKNVPLSAIVKAFSGLLDNLLTEPEAKLYEWKENLTRALGVNAQVLVDVIADLELIIGKQSPVPELEPLENQNRFNNLFHNFLSVFTQKEHPIVLFLDDLQWADSHSLQLIKQLTINSDNKYLLLIGAYRDNEVDELHPLALMIEEIKKTGKQITDIHLGPLNRENILELLKDTLHLENETGLTTLVDIPLKKIGGNPFFLKEFLKTLYKEEIIKYDHSKNIWEWDDEKILHYPLTDNVIDLIVNNLKKLPKKAIDIISYASCLGNQFNLEFLSIISEISIENVAINLWVAIEEGILIPIGKAQSLIQLIIEKNSLLSKEDLRLSLFRFQHDRVEQAAYTFIDEKRKKEVHLKVARLLLKNIDKELLDEKILDITSHYILALDLVQTYEERIQLIELNLKGSLKAKTSTAYETAKTLLLVNEQLIKTEDWKPFFELVFRSKLLLAEVLFLLGDYDSSEKYFGELLEKTDNKSDQVKIYMVQMIKYHLEGKLMEELDLQIKSLHLLGEVVPATDELIQSAVMDELAQIYQLYKSKSEKDILGASLIMNVEQISILKILSKVWVTSYTVSKQGLVAWSSLRMTRISLENGISEFTGFGYVSVAVVLALVGDYQTALAFGNFGLKTCEMFHNSVNIQTYFLYSLIYQWNDYIKNARELYNKFHLLSKEFGDHIYECFAIMFYYANACYWGENITELYKKAKKFEKVQERIFPSNIALYKPTCVQYLASLQGMTHNVGSLNSDDFDEDSHLAKFSDNLAIQTWTLIPKLQVLFIFSMYTDAFKLALRADEFAAVRPGQYVVAVLYFFSSLSILQNLPKIESEEEKNTLLTKVNSYQEKLKLWATLCEANFLNKYFLVEAELERVKGNEWKSIEHYTESIRLSKKYDFINDEAIANELFARFWLEKGNSKIASLYMKEAYKLYNDWGANGKCEQLEKKYPEFLKKEIFQIQSKEDKKRGLVENLNSDLLNTASSIPSNSIDISSIIDASQAISKEIEYEKLIAKLVKILLENAGAQRVVLFSYDKNSLYMEAAGTAEDKLFFLDKPIPIDRTGKQIPFSIIQYVTRTNKSVVLNNAAIEGQFIRDEYISKQNIQSILCAPLISKGKLMGLIYLENNLSAGAFTESRVETIQALASQAAISIENAKLYKNIEIVTREQTRVATEFEIAEKIQTALLVKETKMEGYEIAAYMQACDKIGGDYYDVIHTEGYDWLVIGDVSGHGLTAGLIMMMVQTAIRSVVGGGLQTVEDMSSLIKRVNHVISENIQKMNLKNYMYMTLTLFLKQGDTFYFTGLHQDILIYRHKTKSIERIETEGSWLGLEAIFNTFFVGKFDLEAGDILFLYTDGVTEASHHKTNEMLTVEGVEKFLQKLEFESAVAIRDNLLRILEDYQSNDDITFMVVYKSLSEKDI